MEQGWVGDVEGRRVRMEAHRQTRHLLPGVRDILLEDNSLFRDNCLFRDAPMGLVEICHREVRARDGGNFSSARRRLRQRSSDCHFGGGPVCVCVLSLIHI